MKRHPLLQLLAALLLCIGLGLSQAEPANAGPVDWHEVPATSEGRQWWDAGSLRLTRDGNISVLSRFQPAAANGEQSAEPAERPAVSELYVMEIDCGQSLFRDTSVNGIPQWGSHWQAAAGDGLVEETLSAVCAAWVDRLAVS